MTSKSKKKGNLSAINTGNSLTIDTISDTYHKFLDGINNQEEITFELTEIDEIDLTGLQFLSFLKKWEESKNIKLNLNFTFSENATLLMNRTGFGNLLNTL